MQSLVSHRLVHEERLRLAFVRSYPSDCPILQPYWTSQHLLIGTEDGLKESAELWMEELLWME